LQEARTPVHFAPHSSRRFARPRFAAIALLGSALFTGCTGAIGDPPGAVTDRPSGTGTGGPTTGSGPGGTGGPGTTGGPNAVCNATTPERIWRLSDEEFTNAVSDLLPGNTVPAITTPGRVLGEFINNAERYPADGALTSSIRTSAKAVAASAVKNLTGLVSCSSAQVDATCAGTFIDRFAPRAFRRPIDATERQALLTVYAQGAKATPADGVRLVLEAILQSPSFLYRTELGQPTTPGKPTPLGAYELATALSFLIIDSIPDDELWGTAQDGSITMPDVFARQADRLLASPRGRNNIARIYLKWLGLGAGVTVELSAAMYPEYNDAMRQSMLEESSRFLAGLVSQNGTFTDLFTSRQTYVDSTLAKLYGVPYTGSGFVATTLPAERSGILTQAGVLTSKSRGHPIVIRGKFVRRDLFCQDIQPPPPTVNIMMFSGMGLTERQQATARANDPVCGQCHHMMDPIGISFEKYDALSRYVPTNPDGTPVDSAGKIDLTDVDGPLNSPLELAAKLGQSAEVRACVAQNMLAYANGRELSTADQCEHDRLAAQVQVLGSHLTDWIGGIVHSPAFAWRTGGN
jgi:hypothetical protein